MTAATEAPACPVCGDYDNPGHERGYSHRYEAALADAIRAGWCVVTPQTVVAAQARDVELRVVRGPDERDPQTFARQWRLIARAADVESLGLDFPPVARDHAAFAAWHDAIRAGTPVHRAAPLWPREMSGAWFPTRGRRRVWRVGDGTV